MKQITFYLDFISPYAYLAFEHLPCSLVGLGYSVEYKPVLFAGMLKKFGQLGPAEIAPKRDWTYRHALWLADKHDIAMQMPAGHPFNSLALLRLAIAGGKDGFANRHTCEAIFRHVWQGGADAADLARLGALRSQLKPGRDADSQEVKAQLRSNTELAIAHGVFGVPAFEVDDRLFWGFDALAMLRDYLVGDAWFERDAWDAVSKLPSGVTRSTEG